MVIIPGYQIVELLYESSSSLIYRGWRDRDRLPVILKLLDRYPSLKEIARFRLEYEITSNFNLEGVVKAYSLETCSQSLMMVLEDLGGESLSKLRLTCQFSLEELLKLAKAITEILGQIHQQNIVHKDINPSNIVFNPVTKQLKIIDFGISSVLLPDNNTIANSNILEGTLAYISPEQTGRMNRSIDYRTDFYSLGVTLYQLLCDRLPFETTDANELVHCHLAKQPIALYKIKPEIPIVVSDLVLKLLVKNPEKRYQSSWGICADIEECLQQLQNHGEIKTFTLGSRDIGDKFHISQKLYGRDKEIQALLATFARVAENRSEIVIVSGDSGIGKSALVGEIEAEILQRQGYFITGKFERLNSNIPYYGWICAIQQLVERLLTEPEAEVQIWRDKLLTTLGNNGRVIVDLIPELELIIGKQIAATELPPAEAENRFNLVWQSFIRVFTQPEHPLVIFLDDLQWADRASLNLIQLLMTALNNRYLLVIGACRTDEVDARHLLSLMLNKLESVAVKLNYIDLNVLSLDDINRLIADTLHCELANSKPLAKLVQEKTAGNPFFINRFLKSLYQKQLIYFEFPGGWQWNVESLQTQIMQSADNVVDLIIDKLQYLSATTQQILKIAACLGEYFDLKTLVLVNHKSFKDTAIDLLEAVEQGSIVPLVNEYKYLTAYTQEVAEDLQVTYKFIHDRVQQVIYSTIVEIDKKSLHLQIGRSLLQSTTPENLSDKIFTIVNHLNLGMELITEPKQQEELARLNLVAGKKAKSSVAYAAALTYFNMGRKLLGKANCLESSPLTLDLYSSAAEAAYLNGDFEQMQRLTEIVLQQFRNPLDRVVVYSVKIQAYIAQNQFLEAIATARQVLQTLGVKLPEHPSKWDLIWGKFKTQLVLQGKTPTELADLPLMSDPYKLAAMKTIASICTPTYFITPQLWQLMVFQKIQLSLKYGNAPGSPFGYADYGMVLAVEGNLEASYQFARLALNLLSRLKATEFKPKTFLLVNIYIRHWREHLRETLNPLLEAYQAGLATGDLEYAVFCLVFRFYHSYLVGRELPEIAAEMATYDNAIAQFKLETPLYIYKIYRQVTLNLMGESENPCCLSGESYDESRDLPLHLAKGDRYTIFHLYLNKLILNYLFQDYPQAVADAERTEELLLTGAVGLLLVPVFYFYASLTHLALFSHVSPTQQQQILTKVAANQKKMQTWANHAPMNYLPKFYLVEAEKYRLLGKTSEAIDAYDRALALTKEHQYQQETALTEELTAQFYLDRGKTQIARVYFLDARYSYFLWGATAKVKDLETRYPQLLSSVPSERLSTTTTSSTRNEVLELATVMKASQALSEEMLLDKLLAKLIQILIENAGAETGCLILETQGKLSIEARGSFESDSCRSSPISCFRKCSS